MLLHTESWSPQSVSPSPQKICLVHGMGGTGKVWRPVAAELVKNGYAVLAPDQRGHGRSRTNLVEGKAYEPAEYGADLVQTLHSLNWLGGIGIGHSMGVRSVVLAASQDPTVFGGIVLVDLNFSGLAGGGFGEKLSQLLRILPDRFGSRDEARRFLKQNAPDASIGQFLVAVLEADAQNPPAGVVFPFDREALIQTLKGAEHFNFAPILKTLAQKGLRILVLRGQNSTVFDQKSFDQAQTQFKEFKNVLFGAVPDSGHGAPFENRQGFVKMVMEAFSSDSSVPSAS